MKTQTDFESCLTRRLAKFCEENPDRANDFEAHFRITLETVKEFLDQHTDFELPEDFVEESLRLAKKHNSINFNQN